MSVYYMSVYECAHKYYNSAKQSNNHRNWIFLWILLTSQQNSNNNNNKKNKTTYDSFTSWRTLRTSNKVTLFWFHFLFLFFCILLHFGFSWGFFFLFVCKRSINCLAYYRLLLRRLSLCNGQHTLCATADLRFFLLAVFFFHNYFAHIHNEYLRT